MSRHAYDPRPDSLSGCLDDDLNIVPELFLAYHARLDDEREAARVARAARSARPARNPKKKRRRSTASNFCIVNTETGEVQKLDPRKSTWWVLYVANSPTTERQQQKFRRRARMSHQQYLELLATAREENWFPDAGKADATGKEGAPLELLILGALRYIGRGWTFDDLEEATAISEERHRRFFHEFILVGATKMYDRWVKKPNTAEEAETHMHEYTQAGFPGALFSSDGVHVTSERVQARLKNLHLGPKESHTARAYNATVNHRRRVLYTTRGAPSSWNDKILVGFDDLLVGIENGTLLQDVTFVLLEPDGLGGTREHLYCGVYSIVDNGYPDRATLISPMKRPATLLQLRWSKWLESLRKDVECTCASAAAVACALVAPSVRQRCSPSCSPSLLALTSRLCPCPPPPPRHVRHNQRPVPLPQERGAAPWRRSGGQRVGHGVRIAQLLARER